MKKRGKFRKAVFVVVYKINKNTNKPEYLILRRKKHWKGWEFPKGGIEKGETLFKTLKREIREETGSKPVKIQNFNVSGRYKYQKMLADRPGIIGQTYALFSAEIRDGKIKIDKEEHYGYKWLDFEDAIKILTWPNQKKCLGVVDKSLR